ncbi:hypothetical protein [Paraburkholderia aspalathi]|nr:hypothetical protein [Paraburkholderia aspalathi]
MQLRKFCLKVQFQMVCVAMLAVVVPTAYADDSFTIAGKSINAVIDGQSRQCALDITPSYAVESADGGALMVSERGYVVVSDLKVCRSGAPVHVSEIPNGVGFLSDINVAKGVYVALDFVSTQPTLYLATVAKIGSKKNMVTLGGAYTGGKGVSQLKRAAFSASGDAGSSVISPDGRYVAPNGQLDCGEDAYPGVWDIQKNKRVAMDGDACNALFTREK